MEQTIQSAGLNRLINLIDYYFSLGGMQVQFNVVSRETLLRAQKDPAKYQNLIVRVAGYSSYFVNLEKQVQQDIIDRTEERIKSKSMPVLCNKYNAVPVF